MNAPLGSINDSPGDSLMLDQSPKLRPLEESPFKLLTAQLVEDSSRVDVELLMTEFRDDLGPAKWEEYRDSLSNFFLGKLSRPELVRVMRDTIGLKGPALKNHNTLVLSILANCYRDFPPGAESSLTEWKSKTQVKSRYASIDSANNRMNREILTLPAGERRRIKDIAKEAINMVKQPIFALPYPSLTQTRQAILPRIPYPEDRQAQKKAQEMKLAQAKAQAQQNSIPNNKNVVLGPPQIQPPMNANGPDPSVSSSIYDPSISLHPGHTSSPINWTQNIIQAFDTELASESREIPDHATLSNRMLGLALEEGVLGGIGMGTTDIMLTGLEFYLRNVVEQLMALKHRSYDGTNPLNAEDLSLLMETRPTEMGEVNPTLYKLKYDYLLDEESVNASKKRETPLDFVTNQKLKLPYTQPNDFIQDQDQNQNQNQNQNQSQNNEPNDKQDGAQDNAKPQDSQPDPLTDPVKTEPNASEPIANEISKPENTNTEFKDSQPADQTANNSEPANPQQPAIDKSQIESQVLNEHNKGIEIINSLF